MTISSPTFQRLQSGIKSADDLRVKEPINAMMAWLSGGLITQLNSQFDAISQSVSVQIAAQIATISTIGKHKIWVPASQIIAQTAGGPASANVAGTEVQYNVLDFDQTSIEIAHFNISMPSSWNEGTVTFIPVWTAASGSGDVLWRLNAVAKSNDDAIATTYSGSVDSLDTLIAAADLHRGPESSALTIDGTPAANDTVFFRLFRVASNIADTLNADARLIGVELFITTAAAVDVA
jgi:hypothetical protein